MHNTVAPWTNEATITITAAEGTTPVIPYKNARGGILHTPTGITSLTFWSSSTENGTFKPLQEISDLAAPTAVVLAVANDEAYPFPDACFGAAYLKIVGDAGGDLGIVLKG